MKIIYQQLASISYYSYTSYHRYTSEDYVHMYIYIYTYTVYIVYTVYIQCLYIPIYSFYPRVTTSTAEISLAILSYFVTPSRFQHTQHYLRRVFARIEGNELLNATI